MIQEQNQSLSYNKSMGWQRIVAVLFIPLIIGILLLTMMMGFSGGNWKYTSAFEIHKLTRHAALLLLTISSLYTLVKYPSSTRTINWLLALTLVALVCYGGSIVYMHNHNLFF